MPERPGSVPDVSEREAELLSLLDELKAFERNHHLDNRFNLFTATDMVTREIKHTKFLAFLLDPLESHGVGDRFLRRILSTIIHEHPSSPVSRLDAAIADLGSVAVHTERDHFDIAIEIPHLKVLVVIENKIDTSEGKDQLSRYRKRAEERYKDLTFLGALLTPIGYEGRDTQWGTLSYTSIAADLKLLLEEGVGTVDIEVVIRHYIQLIERKIVPSQELIDACKTIYRTHRSAIDLIIQHGQEPAFVKAVDEFIRSTQQELAVLTVRSTTAYFVFAEWLKIVGYPQADKRLQWLSDFPVQLWFDVKAKKVFLHLEVGPFKDHKHLRENVVATLRKELGKSGSTLSSRRPGSIYTRVWNISESLADDPSVEDMTACLKALWEKAPIERIREGVTAAVSTVSDDQSRTVDQKLPEDAPQV